MYDFLMDAYNVEDILKAIKRISNSICRRYKTNCRIF